MQGRGSNENTGTGGLAVWLLKRMQRQKRTRPRLELLERIALGPRQSLALVETEGIRFLVATSAEGSPAFYRLNGRERAEAGKNPAGRISW